MKKIGKWLGLAVLIGGMVYAVAVSTALPASACTPTQCSDISQNIANYCFAFDPSCTQGGQVISCDSSGFNIFCYGCREVFGGQCG